MKALCVSWSTILFASALAHAGEANLLVNPGFETGAPQDDGGWILFDQSRYSTDAARTGQRSMFNWAYSRTVSYPPYFIGSVSGSYQELPAEPGSRWRLTGYGSTLAPLGGSPAFGILQISFFDGDGNDLGTVETTGTQGAKAKTSNEINARTPVREWVLLDTGIATAPPKTATIQAFTLYVDYSGANTSQGVYFDDLTLCAVTGSGTSACD